MTGKAWTMLRGLHRPACALAVVLICAMCALVCAEVGQVIFTASGPFRWYPDGQFNRRPVEVGGGIDAPPSGDFFIAGKDTTAARVCNRQVLSEPIPAGSCVRGEFWFYFLNDPPPGAACADMIHKIGNNQRTKLVTISVEQPGIVAAGDFRNHLVVRTTAGDSFRSTNAYNFATDGPNMNGWHKIEYFIKVADGTAGKIRLKIDNNDEGGLDGIDTRQGVDWQYLSYGVITSHRQPLDYCFDDITVEYCGEEVFE